jgi:hypothetical protein
MRAARALIQSKAELMSQMAVNVVFEDTVSDLTWDVLIETEAFPKGGDVNGFGRHCSG